MNLRESEDIKILKSELLFRVAEPFIRKLMKYNGLCVDSTNEELLELICKLETITNCPVIMKSPRNIMYICLDLLRVRPMVLKETYKLFYLYRDNRGRKISYTEDYFYSVPVTMDKDFNIYDGFNIDFYTKNNDFKPLKSYFLIVDKIVLMLTVYDKQLEHDRGNQYVGRGNNITFWSKDEFCLGKEYIATKTANTYIKLVKKSIKKIVHKLYNAKEGKVGICRSKHIIKNMEDHVLQRSPTDTSPINTIFIISQTLYELKYVDIKEKDIDLFVFFKDILPDMKKHISKIELYTKKEIKYYSEEDDIKDKEDILEELLMIFYTNIEMHQIEYYMQYVYNISIPSNLYQLRDEIKYINKQLGDRLK